MLEGLLAPLLERFLGQYIVDLPREQLRVGLWSGVVRLENVRLKRDAFDHLKLPFAVREGTIALLELKVSWKTALLRVHPIVVTLEGIALTASPRAEDEWAAEPAAKRALALKRATLAAAAEMAAQKRRGDGVEGVGSSYVGALVPTILDRLRVKVGAVHVKFTDMPKTRDGEDVSAFGLRMDSLLVATSKVEREPEADPRTSPGDVDASTAATTVPVTPEKDKDDADAPNKPRTPKSGDGSSSASASRKQRKTTSSSSSSSSKYGTLRGLLARVTPVGEARKRVEVRGLRVYAVAPRDADETDESTWYPAPVSLALDDGPTFRTRHDDEIDPDDVLIGAETLTATLAVASRGRARLGEDPSTRSPGFNVRVEVQTAVGLRVRPSQARSLIRLSDAACVWALREKHGARRPTEPRDWRAWWRYAARSVGRGDDAAETIESTTKDLLRYTELYMNKIRAERVAGDASVDDSFGEDQFYDCEDPSELEGTGLELYSLENELALDALLAARERAERSVLEEEDEEDDFVDAEEDMESGDDPSDEEDGAARTSYFGWAARALYRRGGDLAFGAVGLAKTAAASAATLAAGASSYVASSVSGSGADRSAAPAAAFTLEARRLSLVLCSEPPGASSSAETFRVELREVRAEMDAPDGVALRVDVDDIEGWVLGSNEDESSTRAAWRRLDPAEKSPPPAMRATQRASTDEDASTLAPLEVRFEPLNVVAHPSLAAVLEPFSRQVTGTHFQRILSAACELPGDAPRARLARAVASLDLQLQAQPWKVEMSQPLILLPSASSPRDAAVAAIELGTLAVEYAPGGGRALRPERVEALRKHAERAVLRGGKDDEDADEALFALEQVATTHQVALSFAEASVSVPARLAASGSNRNAAATWTPLAERLGGSASAVMRGVAVGGASAANRAKIRLEPVKLSLTPESVAALGVVAEAANAVATAATPPSPPTSGDASRRVVGPDPASELDFAAAEVSVSARLDPLGPEYRAVVRRVDARWTSSRDGRAWFDVGAHSVSVESGGRAIARVNAVGSHPFVQVDGALFTTGTGESSSDVRVWMCGLETMVTHCVMADAAAFASSVAERRDGGDRAASREPNFLGLARFGRRGATRRSIRLVPGVGVAEDESARNSDWAALGEPISTSSSSVVVERSATTRGATTEFTLRSATKIVLVDGAGAEVPVAVVDVAGVRARFEKTPGDADDALAFTVKTARVWSPAAERDAGRHALLSRVRSEPGELDVALLRVGARAEVKIPSTDPSAPRVDLTVTTVRVGAHAEAAFRIASWASAATASAAATAADAEPEPEPEPEPDASVSSPKPPRAFGSVRLTVLDSALYVPSPRDGDASVSARGRGFLVSLGEVKLATRLPLVDAADTSAADTSSAGTSSAGTSPAPTSFFVDGVRVCAVAPDEREWAAALLPPTPMERKNPAAPSRVESLPAFLVVGATRARETVPDARSFAVDVPLVSVTATPGTIALLVDAARGFESASASTRAGTTASSDGDESRVADATARRTKTERRLRVGVGVGDASRRSPARAATDRKIRWDIAELRTPPVTPEKSARLPASPRSPRGGAQPWSASFELALGRVSFLAQSSDARVGGFGVAGDETAALVTLAALRVTARTGPARDGSNALGVEASFESAHALDVSGTLAGEAERMAAGVTLSDRFADAGVPLAWIGSSATGSRTSVALRALVDPSSVASSIPSSSRVDVALGGGGFAANVPAWDRVLALRAALADDDDDESRDVGVNGGRFAATPEKERAKKTVTFADEQPAAAEVSANLNRGDGEKISERTVKVSASTGEWTMTLPWNPPDAGARAVRVLFDATASASADVDAATLAPTRWNVEARVGRVKLEVEETARDARRGSSTSPVAEIRALRVDASSGGGEWSSGVSVDVSARDAALAVSSRRLRLLGEASRLFDDDARPTAATTTTRSTDASADDAASASVLVASVTASLTVDTIGVLVLRDAVAATSESTASFENVGAPIVEGAALGLSASLATDPARVALNVESRVLLDFLNHDKGAWEPVVEPWRIRVGVDVSLTSDATPSRVSATFAGVDALELVATEAGAAAFASVASTIGDAAAADPSADASGGDHSYWLRNATSVPLAYWLAAKEQAETDDEPHTAPEPSSPDVVAPGGRALLHFAEVKSRAAPRYSRVAGVETLVAPAPPPPPAPLRAVVIQLAGASSPTAPIPLDRPASHVLPRDARGDDETEDAARLVAEVRRVPNAPRGSRERYELLVRTDLAFHNATLTPLEFRLEPRRDVASAPAAVTVAPGSTFWLPAAFAGASAARARWRPSKPESSRRMHDRDGNHRAASRSSPSPSPLRRGAGPSRESIGAEDPEPEPEDERVDDFSWSEPIPLRGIAADDESSSSSPPPPPAVSSATTRDARTTPFRCLVGARENPEGASRVIAVAPPLVVSNALPVALTVSVSFAGRPDVSRAAPGRVVPPGGVVAMHDDALHPTSPVTLHARPHGYTHCESVAVPALARATRLRVSTSGDDDVEDPSSPPSFVAYRDVFAVRLDESRADAKKTLASAAAVSVRVRVTTDEHGTRRVYVSAPRNARNETADPLVLRAATAEEEDAADAAALRLEDRLDDDDGAEETRRRDERLGPVPAAAGEGDCWLAARREGRSGEAPPGLRSPRPRHARSTAILNLDASPGQTHLRLLESSGARPTPTPSRPESPEADAAAALATHVVDVSDDSASESAGTTSGFGSGASLAETFAETNPDADRNATATANGAGVAMFGRSTLWRPRGDSRARASIRLRAPDASTWSAATRLALGEKPKVVRCPAATTRRPRSKACHEYLVSLRDADAVVVQPRFAMRFSHPLGEDDAGVWIRQPGAENASLISPGGETRLTLWGAGDAPRRVRLRPDAGGVWSWSAPAPVDCVGVVLVKSVRLSRDGGAVGGIVRRNPSATEAPSPAPMARKQLGFGLGLGGDDEGGFGAGLGFGASASTPPPTTTTPARASRPGPRDVRAYRVVVSASATVPGAFVADISELTAREATAAAPVRVENRSGVTVSVRQANARAPRGERVPPRATAAFLWDDPEATKALTLAAPDSSTRDVPILADVPLDWSEEDEEANDARSRSVEWSRLAVVRFDDPDSPPTMIRARARRPSRPGEPAALIVEEIDARGNPTAAAAAKVSAEMEAEAAARVVAVGSPFGSPARATLATTPPPALAKTGKHFASPVATRVMAHVLPPRFRPIAKAIAFAADRASAAVMTSAPPFAANLVVDVPSVGVSLVDAGSGAELLYARVSDARTTASARGAVGTPSDPFANLREGSVSVRVSRVRADLQTPASTSNPVVFAAGEGDERDGGGFGGGRSRRGGRPALTLKAVASKPSSHHVASSVVSSRMARRASSSEASDGWRLRSAAVDVAPMTVDLREELLTAAPGVLAAFAAPFDRLAEARRISASVASPSPTNVVAATMERARADSGSIETVRVGRVDVVVSFTALPFLPVGVRSIGAVDRASVSLRAFQLPFPSAPSTARRSWTPEQVATLALRHYLAESATQIVRLVASNKLLGDPARLWSEIVAAASELRSAPARRGAGRRFRRRVAAAVAAWAKTILEHAREVAEEAESRFESARARRLERLASRRIADGGDESRDGREGDEDDDEDHRDRRRDGRRDDADGSDDDRRGSTAHPLALASSASSAGARPGLVGGVVYRALRAAGSLVEGPLQGAELGGVPGFVEGAAEGVFGAAASVASAALALASDLTDRLASYGGQSVDDDGLVQRLRGAGPPRLRPPRPPPASLLEPILPYNGVEASARELQAFAAKGRFAREQYVGGASLTRPRGAFVAVTSRRLLVGIAVASSAADPESEPTGDPAATTTGAASWLTREALPHGDIVAVETDRTDARVVVVRALPRRAPKVDVESTDATRDERGGGWRIFSRVPAEKEDDDEAPKDAPTNEGRGEGMGIGIREVALYCSDEVAARKLVEQLAALTNAAAARAVA